MNKQRDTQGKPNFRERHPFADNVATELERHGHDYGRATYRAALVALAFLLVKDLEIFDALSWWWLVLPALRCVGLGIFLVFIGFMGNRD